MTLASIADVAQIILADIVLSGDNALIIGLAASSLPPALRAKAILFGMAMAAILRIIFAIFATYLLSVQGLLFMGGLLLLWVCWRLYREIRESLAARAAAAEASSADPLPSSEEASAAGEGGDDTKKNLWRALVSITVADVSMSIDNVLAVAAIARDNTAMLVFGLVLAIALMGFCATIIVRLLNRFPAISWIGLFVLIYVSGRMLYDGWPDFAGLVGVA